MHRPRISFPGAIYHVNTRGNDGISIFADDWDRIAFLGYVEAVVRKDGWRCYAYCLMTNHYHLLVETPEANVAVGMERLNGAYARRYNRRHGRRNHLFGRRYHDELVARDAHFLETARYIVLNPVRAGLCREPGLWGWSSYLATAGRRTAPSFLSAAALLEQFGRRPAIAEARYCMFVAEGMTLPDMSRNLPAGRG